MEKLKTPEVKDEFREILDLVDLANVNVIDKLGASNDKTAKAEFLENPELTHPNNEYGNLDITEVQKNLETLDKAEEALENSSLNDKRKRLIKLTIDNYRNKNDFVAANLAYNTAKTPQEKELAAKLHKKTNEALYGKPDENTFYSILNEKLAQIDVGRLSEEDRKIYDELMREIGPVEESRVERFKPKQETIQRFASYINLFFEGFLRHIPEGKEKFSSEEVVNIINEILEKEFGGLDVKYQAKIDSEVGNASVEHEKHIIKFPEDKVYTRKKARQLILHELGTHVMRAIPYLGSDIDVFAIGLPGNEEFDEGIAKCIEHAIAEEYEDAGLNHYINIGLATFKNKNFREVYEIRKKLQHLIRDKTYEADGDKMLTDVQRCFRGTGELPNNKDLVYYSGTNRVWKYIEENIDDPNLFDNLFLTGKANITNPVQEALSYEMRTGNL